jgi:GT2 family glycosyltransferase
VRTDTLTYAVESIRRQTFDDWELIIVGQGEDPRLKAVGEAAEASDRRIRYIHSQARGLSLARNIGMYVAEGEIVAMTDDDCEAREDWLASIVECFEQEEDADFLGGAVLRPKASQRFFAVCPYFHPPESVYDPVASRRRPPEGWGWMGANFAFRRRLLEMVGPFDRYLGAGAIFPSCEDVDYRLRLESLGVKVRSTPRCVVNHTYGYRYGLRTMLRHSRNYAVGNGGLAAKLTLLGDPRGADWLKSTRNECLLGTLRELKLHRYPIALFRLKNYWEGYHRCLRDFEIDADSGLLRAKDGSEASVAAPGLAGSRSI